ncbi:MAG: DUF1343 domain-containing protein [Bacteroidetes bacterium]|nr:DUF1343 domain-containing protein [Bacteroidota bacterium]MBS1931546.1 DUF1343 domain-containing protein [Bacteroidota bacterium]
MENKKTKLGIDCFLQLKSLYKNIRFGLVTNNAATTSGGESSRNALLKAGFTISRLFSPEHGLSAQGEDGAYQKNIIDPLTQLPVTSLYGEKLIPDEEDFTDIDILLFDIPDVGCRFYTYLWTMTYMMEACVKFKKPLYILDRPNPTSGNISLSEGPMLDEHNCSSFIGRWNIPVRHSCTIGELANYFSFIRLKNIDLKIIKIQNWNRKHVEKKVNWHFMPPSPAIKDVETALLYPGMGLLEGINVNEGRGTATPFKIFGAPWINANYLKEEFDLLEIQGINSKSISYKPANALYANETCYGLKLTITDPEKFRPVNIGLQLIKLILSLHPEQCEERLYKTRANPSGSQHLDKLTGIFNSFKKMKTKEIISSQLKTEDWKEKIKPYLYY